MMPDKWTYLDICMSRFTWRLALHRLETFPGETFTMRKLNLDEIFMPNAAPGVMFGEKFPCREPETKETDSTK